MTAMTAIEEEAAVKKVCEEVKANLRESQKAVVVVRSKMLSMIARSNLPATNVRVGVDKKQAAPALWRHERPVFAFKRT